MRNIQTTAGTQWIVSKENSEIIKRAEKKLLETVAIINREREVYDLVINVYDGKGGFKSILIAENAVRHIRSGYTNTNDLTITMSKTEAKKVLKRNFCYDDKF